jgi:hypothetical protein
VRLLWHYSQLLHMPSILWQACAATAAVQQQGLCFRGLAIQLWVNQGIQLTKLRCLLQAVKAAKVAESEVSKLNYRILHLVRSLRQADGKPASS